MDIKQIEQETGLTVTRVETRAQMDKLLDSGLAKLYQDVFGGAPYYEEFTLDEVKDIFREFLDKKGIVFTAQDGDRPVAFVVSVPLRAEFELAKLAKPYGVNAEEAAYFAEDGVAADYRRNGLSGKLKKLLLETNSAEGLKQVLLRTSTKNHAQISAVYKAGGRSLQNAFQNIVRKTKDGQEVDRNSFYLFDGNDNKPKTLERVMIVRTETGVEKAFVFGRKGGALWNMFLTDEIKDSYPRIARVKYVSSVDQVEEGKVIFDGRMYLTKPVYDQTRNALPPIPC